MLEAITLGFGFFLGTALFGLAVTIGVLVGLCIIGAVCK